MTYHSKRIVLKISDDSWVHRGFFHKTSDYAKEDSTTGRNNVKENGNKNKNKRER